MRILTNIEISKPDRCHQIGQALIRPLSCSFGRTFKVENQNIELVSTSTIKKIIFIIASTILFPVTLVLGGVGALLLKCSKTHKESYVTIQKMFVQIIWNKNRPEIHSARLTLRPILQEDLPVYQKLFNNPIAMENYSSGVRDITSRFKIWLERWNEHSFSALAIVDNKDKKVIGHLISGHGDYEGNFTKGWSEVAVVIDPAYWNADYKNTNKGIGIADRRHIGSEAMRCAVVYMRSLKERSVKVPCDVIREQRAEIEEAIKQGKDVKVQRNAANEIDWIYLPFTQLRATAKREAVSYKMVEKLLPQMTNWEKTPKSAERDLFVLNM